jgi:hypothetical protein
VESDPAAAANGAAPLEGNHMHTLHGARSIAEPTAMPNLDDTGQGHRVLRRVLLCLAVVVTALAIAGATQLRSDPPAKIVTTPQIHQPLLSPEEKAFIDRCHLVQSRCLG